MFGAEERSDVLASLLNAVITDSGGVPMRHLQLVNPFSIKETIDDRIGILDIRARDDWDRDCLVEMQMVAHASLSERLVWYISKCYQQQLAEGERYTTLRPVILVCFLNDTLFADNSGQYHWCFKLLDKDSGRLLTDQFVIHIVELPKFKKSVDELVSELDRWTYFLKHGSTLDHNNDVSDTTRLGLPQWLAGFCATPKLVAILSSAETGEPSGQARWGTSVGHVNNLPLQLQNADIIKAVGGLVMFSLDEQKQHEYTRRRMWEMDQKAYLDGALQKGEQIGRKEGRTEQGLTMLLRVGTRKFGVPPAEVLAQLKAIQNVSELEVIMDRVLEALSWDEMLRQRSESL